MHRYWVQRGPTKPLVHRIGADVSYVAMSVLRQLQKNIKVLGVTRQLRHVKPVVNICAPTLKMLVGMGELAGQYGIMMQFCLLLVVVVVHDMHIAHIFT